MTSSVSRQLTGGVVVVLGLLAGWPGEAAAQRAGGPKSVVVATPINIPSGPGPASPYPLVIPVSGISGDVTVELRLRGLRHTWPTDLDILLVAPNGHAVMVMSDVDAGPVNGVDLTFKNGAPLPPTTLVSGTYRPSDRFPGDSLPVPAPGAPYLPGFSTVPANGSWLLYVADDSGGDAGSIDSVELLFRHQQETRPSPLLQVDNGSIDIPLTFSGITGAVASLTPYVGIDHNAVGELDVYLIAPDGTQVALSRGNGGNGDNMGRAGIQTCLTSFDDGAAVSIAQGLPPYAGSFRPEEPLWALAGAPANGVWRIRVVDRAPGNIASISCAGLRLRDDGPTSVADAFAVPADVPLNVPAPGVLANDIPNRGGGTLTATLVAGPAHGTVSLAANGGFVYTPVAGFAGVDSFSYRSLNDAGTGTTATVSVTVFHTRVQPPSGLHAWSMVGNEVTFRWTGPALGPAPTAYLFEGGVQPGEVLASIPTGSGLPAFTLAVPTGSFHVRVRSVLGGDISGPSNELPIHVGTPLPPSAPADLTAVVTGSTLGLAWRPTFAGGVPTGLMLHVSGSANAAIPLAVSSGSIFTGVPAGSYTLGLQATNAAGVSALSNPVSVTLPAGCTGPPQPPQGFLAFRTGGLLTVVWDAAATGPAATGFVLNVSGAFVGSVPVVGRSISAPVGPGTYSLSLRATNPCGASALTPVQSVTMP